MAIGLAQLFGFNFRENFNYPYVSKSITEFWRRWHISLSSWFRDYVYIPLGGSRKGNIYINLFIVFLLTGIWHGAKWSFIAWGLWHGFFIILEKWLSKQKWNVMIPGVLRWLYTMGVVVLGWIFFRANSLLEALEYFKRMVGRGYFYFQPFGWRYYLNNKVIFVLVIAILLSVLPVKSWVERLRRYSGGEIVLKVLSVLLLITSLLVIVNSSYSPFIYFRF